MTERTSTRRARLLSTNSACMAVLACAVVCLLLSGCGGPRLALTGGSIPIGAASLRGLAVRADDTGKPITNARVILSVNMLQAESETDSSGQFSFDSIAPGKYVCTITATQDNVRVWSYPIEIPKGGSGQLIAGMLPSTFDPSSISQVRLVPDGYSLNVGESVRFTAQAVDTAGSTLDVKGSFMVGGDVGELDSNGSFHATKPGTAAITAWAGNATTAATLQVIP